MSELIDRQQAIDAIENSSKPYVWQGADIIRRLPTIQPEQCGDKSYTLWKESYEELKRRMDELTSCSDIISRRAAIDALQEEIDKGIPPFDDVIASIRCGVRLARNIIEDLPSAQPEPKEGHWIPHESPDGGEQYECSRCGVLWEFNDGSPEDNEAYFCPKCGKKLITK